MRIHDHTLRAAAALGAATGLRSVSGLGALTFAGEPTLSRPRVAAAVRAWAVGELVADKVAPLPPRTHPLLLGGRLVFGAAVGIMAAHLGGGRALTAALVAAAAAAATAVAGTRLRARATTAGLPDGLVAVGEDLCMLALARSALR